jgi:hypothetical protein
MYYRRNRLCSYDALGNIILSERGTGKSFCFKEWAINDDNAITIWLRRTDVQRKKQLNWKNFLNDLLKEGAIELPSETVEYKVTSEGVYKNGIQKVIHSALSVDTNVQSMVYLPDLTGKTYVDGIERPNKKPTKKKMDISKPIFPIENKENKDVISEIDLKNAVDVKEKIEDIISDIQYDNYTKEKNKQFQKRIVFEEIIEPNFQYLKDEVELFLNFYVTVDRNTDTHFYGLGNRISFYNPYFEYFHISPFTQEFKWFQDKTLLVHNYHNEEFSDMVKQTQFYKMIKGTKFAEYLTTTEVWKDDNSFVFKRPENSKAFWNFKFRKEIYGTWIDSTNNLYVSKKYNKENPTYSNVSERKPGDLLMKKGEGLHRVLVNSFFDGTLFFESINIKYTVMDLINGGYKE